MERNLRLTEKEDYDSMLRKIEIADAKIHKKERSAKQLNNWVNRFKNDKRNTKKIY